VLLALVTGGASLAARDPGRSDRPPRSSARAAVSSVALQQQVNGPSARVAWRRSRSIGRANAGRLVRGVQLPAEGPDWFTWDPVRKRSPNRSWRRWGADHLVRTLLRVLREYRGAHPHAARVGIGDLSREHGGSFGRRFGGLGHASHQNGFDVDVYYPRRDGRERRAYAPRQVDRVLAQDLVDRFAAAGARFVFVGPRLRLSGRRGIVEPLANHDDHLHVRLRRP
jgi:murein endopeptidase